MPHKPFIADFHIHSHYSRATSPQLNTVGIHKWAQIKGIEVIGTGDFTHPEWFLELQEKLEPAEPGLFKLKPDHAKLADSEVPDSCKTSAAGDKTAMRYLLTVEISSIYSKNGRGRKAHSIVCAPSFEVAAKINHQLEKIGNIKHDGRPILGLDPKELMKIVFDTSPDCMFIPAHIWTPHFSIFGSKSGFDSIEECFEEMTDHITALETGLSSDPAMNRLWSDLDRFTLISNSDAHSAMKLGREANRLACERNYHAIKDTLKTGDPSRFLETIEFYPEEGKYHHDGHRACKINFTPAQTAEHKGICPKCNQPLVIGVLNRVQSLADRSAKNTNKSANPPTALPTKIPFRYLVPLPEILSSVLKVGPQSKRITTEYFNLINHLGNEFHLLLDTPLEEIQKVGGPTIAQAIQNMRDGNLHIEPGYDGEFGKVQVFANKEKAANRRQEVMF